MAATLLYLLLGLLVVFSSVDRAYAGSTGSGATTEVEEHEFTALEAKTYALLKKKFVSVVEGNERSTIFRIPVTDLGVPTSWTAADLGVPSLVENGAISQNAMNAIVGKLVCDTNYVVSSLMAELPYQLFWYDKTRGFYLEPQGTVNVWYDQGIGNYKISFSGDLVYSFYVCADYADGEFKVKDASVKRARQAAAEAKEIVRRYAALSDHDKLTVYKDEICNRVNYDEHARDGGVSYGDPWQLVSVFDEDRSTNVVCEGYAKAFQYLCDLTDFDSDKITCRIVTGTIGDGSYTEAHMWNVVTMNDGKNYLVDTTNSVLYCSGIGSPFLVGVSNGDWYGVNKSFRVTTLTGNNSKDFYTYCYDTTTNNIYDEKYLKLAIGSYAGNNSLAEHRVIDIKGYDLKVGESGILAFPAGMGSASLTVTDTSVMTVSKSGAFSTLKAGKTDVTVKRNGEGYCFHVTVEFADVRAKSRPYYYDAVYWAYNKGITGGVKNNKTGLFETFDPQGTCTRAQMVAFLWRMAGCPAPKSNKCPFSDVPSTAYYYKAVIWGTENGIVGGYSDGTFRPDGSCTRQQAVTFLWRMAGSPEPAAKSSSFSDVKNPNAYYYKAVLWASEKGITGGYSDGTFKPGGNCTRCQMVTFLYRYEKNVK